MDVKDPRGREIVLKLVAGADVFSENFKAGTMDKLGLGYDALSQLNPRLVYVSHKGFLPGPYEHRTALDEVVQMMGGLAYMTGPEGRPLRAGSSVNDIMGGMFGAIGVLAALRRRAHQTGRGQEVQSALFENNVLLVAQHMMQFAVTGQAAAPMPSRISAWGIYDVFTVQDGEQIFLAVVSDTQWALFCDAFGLRRPEGRRAPGQQQPARACARLAAAAAARAAGAAGRRRDRRALRGAGPALCADHAAARTLFDDPHLRATGGLAPVTLPADASAAGRDDPHRMRRCCR